jgi:hypothetical protein
VKLRRSVPRSAVPGLAVAGLVLAAGGCTGDPAPAPSIVPGSPPAWTEPARYAFVVDRRCGDRPSLGRYRVIVENAQVTGADRIDGRTAEGEEEIEVPSLGGLVEMAETANEDGAAATVEYDARDGHPTLVTIERDVQECFVVSEYAPVAGG